MTNEESALIVNFMTLGTGVLLLGHGHIRYTVKMQYFFNAFILGRNTTLEQDSSFLIWKHFIQSVLDVERAILINLLL